MNSSNSSNKSVEQPFAGGGGIRVPASPIDPFQALDDLMAAVEALCPRWPQRDICMKTPGMLL
jgi:hypothetical protein